MTIISETNRIKNNISDAYDVLEEKGAVMPTSLNSNNLASTINSISQGSADHAQLANLDYASSGHTGFAKDDLSNLTTTGKKVIDGKWVALSSTLVSNVTIPKDENIEIDLSNILPDDNEMYELLVYAQVNASSTAGSYINLEIGTDIIQNRMSVAASRCQTTGYYGTSSGTVNIPVGTGRKIVVYQRSNDAGTYSLLIRGYRRIGTNQ